MKKKFLANILAAALGFTMLGLSSTVKASEGDVVYSNLNNMGFVQEVPSSSVEENDIELNSIAQGRMNGKSEYPGSVDNSELDAFPGILNQGTAGSCVAMSDLYFTMSHMINLHNELNHTGEGKVVCSPAFGFNATNYGSYAGCDFSTLNAFIANSGVASIKDVPYNGDAYNDNAYRRWSQDSDIWKDAQRYSIKEVKNIGLGETKNTTLTYPKDLVDNQLKTVKRALTNGYVLSFETSYNPKHYTSPENLPDGSANVHGGEDVWGYVKYDRNLKHQMAVVGYDDNIWVDINGNNKVDEGEKGALKIADSYYAGAGYHWIAYDALYDKTYVEGNPDTSSRTAFTRGLSYMIPEVKSPTKLYAKYTLNTAKRNQCRVCLTATNKANGEKREFTPYIFSNASGQFGGQGGAYSFRGFTTADEGDFGIDLRKVVPDITAETIKNYDWTLSVEDTTNDDSDVKLKGFAIIDQETNNEYDADINAENPVSVNGSKQTVSLKVDASKPKALTILSIKNDIEYAENKSEVNKPINIHADVYGGSGKKTYLFTTVKKNKTEQTGHDISVVQNNGTYTWTPTLPGDYTVEVVVYAENGGYTRKTIDYTVYDKFHVEMTPTTEVVRTEKAADGKTVYVVPKGSKLRAKFKAVGGVDKPEIVMVRANYVGDDTYEFSPSTYSWGVYAKDITQTAAYQNSNLLALSFYVKEAE